MTAGLFARGPRLAVLVAVALLATAGLTFAATSTLSTAPTTPPETTSELPPLVVPDVRHQAYVFAKGMLEQGGFAWRVEGARSRLLRESRRRPDARTRLEAGCTAARPRSCSASSETPATPRKARPRTSLRTPAFRPAGSAPRRPGQAKVKAKTKTVSAPAPEGEGDEDHCRREEAEGCREEAGRRRASRPSSCRARPRSRSTR